MSQAATIEERSFHIINELFGASKAGAVIARARKLNPEHREIVLGNFLTDLADVEPGAAEVVFEASREFAGRLIEPVGIEDFMFKKKYLAIARKSVFPVVLDTLIDLNSGLYNEAVLTGGIGTAKTTIAQWTTAYQLYLLSLLLNPQEELGQERSSEIMFIFQSINATLAKTVDYNRFYEMVSISPYFREVCPFDTNLKGQLVFPRRIIVKPVSGQETATIGQNVYGGIMDEVNYMNKVEKSKQSVDGGEFDQAVKLYNSIARRRSSRFSDMGKPPPGMLCLVSSTRYPGEFTDQKIEEAEDPESTIFLYHKTVWEVKPHKYPKERFHIFVGDISRKPRILDPDEEVHPKDRELILAVPETRDFRVEFGKDLINALREIGGVQTLARFPFFMNTELVAASFKDTLPSILDKKEVDFDRQPLEFFRKLFRNPHERRMIHIDLALTGDSVGIACGYVKGFVPMRRTEEVIEMLPDIEIDFTLRVTPPHNDEIKFDKIRALLYKLRHAGLNIQWISFDSFESRYLMQVLRQQSFQTGQVSVDIDTVPYDFLKQAMYDGRCAIPKHDFLQQELLQLEKDQEKAKIDHPPNGSKDVADALAGCVYGLTIKRIIWAENNVSPVSIPEYIQAAGGKRGAMNEDTRESTRRVALRSR